MTPLQMLAEIYKDSDTPMSRAIKEGAAQEQAQDWLRRAAEAAAQVIEELK